MTCSTPRRASSTRSRRSSTAPQRVIYDEAADAPDHPQQQPQLPAGRQRRGRPECAGRPQRLPRQPHGPAQAGNRQAARPDRRDGRVEPNRRRRRQSRDARPSSQRAPTTPRRRPLLRRACCGKVDQTISRVGTENQIALIRELGASFEESVYPGLLDQLAASRRRGGDDDTPPPKQTVSVKTVSAAGVTGVLETEEDVDRYLAALRNALIQTLNDGKRISL